MHHNNVLRVAHLKISSKCVLLDEKFEPKITNFGNAMILMNTNGAPSSSYKEDVYGFGLLLLELVTSREQSTLISPQTDNDCGAELNAIDECLLGQGFDKEIYETRKIA